MRRNHLQILVGILFVPEFWCMYTRWLPNTNINNPFNWDSGRLPCGNDRMIIPDDSPVVFMQINTTIKELILPRDGELVFGSYSTLAFTNEPDYSAACLNSGTDNTFNASHPRSWLDPANWCATDAEEGDCVWPPLLHTERVPCGTSHVVFPRHNSYYVDLGQVASLEVNTLKVSGKAYNTGTFASFLRSDSGRNIFRPPPSGSQPSVTINLRQCTDPTGCGCGNDQGQILEQVCRIQQPRCQRPRCKSPFTPVGHCCQICGGMLNITYGAGFNLDTLKHGLQRNVIDSNDNFKGVSYIVSKRSDGKIQIVITDDNGSKSSKAATQMRNVINADIRTGGYQFAVTRVSLQTSGKAGPAINPLNPSAHTGTGGGKPESKGTVAGITVGVIIAVLLALFGGYLLYRRKTSPDNTLGLDMFWDKFSRFNKFSLDKFSFDRFSLGGRSEGRGREPNVPVPPSVGFSWGSQDSGLSSVSGAMSQGFDNPMFGDSPFETIQPMELEMTPTDFGHMSDRQPIDDKGFDNPLYDTVHQDSSYIDQPEGAEGTTQATVMTIGGPGERPGDTDA